MGNSWLFSSAEMSTRWCLLTLEVDPSPRITWDESEDWLDMLINLVSTGRTGDFSDTVWVSGWLFIDGAETGILTVVTEQDYLWMPCTLF